MAGARGFRKYSVWQEAVDFATFVYEVTGKMPWLTMLTLVTTRANKQAWCLSLLQEFEKKGLCDQLQRAAVSISSNIAEGAARFSDADFAHFLDFALGSAFEVETQLTIAKNVGYFDNVDLNANLNVNLDLDKRGVTYELLRDKFIVLNDNSMAWLILFVKVKVMVRVKVVLKAVWQFCSYVFVPQRRPKDDSAVG